MILNARGSSLLSTIIGISNFLTDFSFGTCTQGACSQFMDAEMSEFVSKKFGLWKFDMQYKVSY